MPALGLGRLDRAIHRSQIGQAPAIPSSMNRVAANRANAQHSTGPRTEFGKQRSSPNSIKHGLTAPPVVLPSEDPDQYEAHRRQFFDEYQPATATETQLVQELVDTSWRLNRIPLLETNLIAGTGRSRPQSGQENAGGPLRCAGTYVEVRAENPPDEQARIDFDIVDAHRIIASINVQGTRLSRQFQKTVEKLREMQDDRRFRERHDLEDAAALLQLHKHKAQPWEPADDGFVLTKEQVELAAQRMMRQNEARHMGYCRFNVDPRLQASYLKHHGL